jgi:hypothetical protein
MSKLRLTSIVVVFLAAAVLVNGEEFKGKADQSTEATTRFGSDHFLFVPGGSNEILMTDVKRNVEYRFSVSGDSNERVTEVRACRWLKRGFALAVETVPEKPEKTDRRSYYWVTGWIETDKISGISKVNRVADQFFTTDQNFDLGMIANPQGDTIYILLTQYQLTTDGYEVKGYTYMNGCPVAPGGGGLLQRIATDSTTMKVINDPDEPAKKP